jgi:hypothetical protein
MQDRPTTPRFSDDGILGPRIAPASPRSTRLAAQRRRKRCGSGALWVTSSDDLTPHKPLSGWLRTLLAKVKQQRRALPAFLKLEWADPFWKSRPEKDPWEQKLTRRSRRSFGKGTMSIKQLLDFLETLAKIFKRLRRHHPSSNPTIEPIDTEHLQTTSASLFWIELRSLQGYTGQVHKRCTLGEIPNKINDPWTHSQILPLRPACL